MHIDAAALEIGQGLFPIFFHLLMFERLRFHFVTLLVLVIVNFFTVVSDSFDNYFVYNFNS